MAAQSVRGGGDATDRQQKQRLEKREVEVPGVTGPNEQDRIHRTVSTLAGGRRPQIRAGHAWVWDLEPVFQTTWKWERVKCPPASVNITPDTSKAPKRVETSNIDFWHGRG